MHLCQTHGDKSRQSQAVILGTSTCMKTVRELTTKAASTDDCVLITGESGTGKEVVAKEIHRKSRRCRKPFIVVNCGAIPENLVEREFFGHVKGAYTGADISKTGLLEAADSGTLFLDEIGEISLGMQIKLLRAIEGGGYSPLGSSKILRPNIRLIGATNKNLQDLVEAGKMRSDFYFRIYVLPIRLPPLRDREQDIELLADHFLTLFGVRKGINAFNPDQRQALNSYQWPGNIRELQNVLRHYCLMGDLDCIRDVGPLQKVESEFAGCNENDKLSLPLAEAMKRFEKRYIFEIIEKFHWNKLQAASHLGISRKTLSKKMKAHGIT